MANRIIGINEEQIIGEVEDPQEEETFERVISGVKC